MLRCQDCARLSSDYIDGNLSWRQRLAVLFHLAMCRACWGYLGQMRQTVGALRRAARRAAAEEDRDQTAADDARRKALEMFRSAL